MTSQDIERLREYTGKTVQISTADGEEMIVKIVILMDEYDDFIYEIMSTNLEHKYKSPLTSAAYVCKFDDIISFNLHNDTV